MRGLGEVVSAFARTVPASAAPSAASATSVHGGGGFSLDAQIEGPRPASSGSRRTGSCSRAWPSKDIELGRQQIALAAVQQQIAVQEREIAGVQLAHAAATADFLATKFTSAELFEWMSGVLNQVYAYFLRQATALARLAQAQLAFERQEPNRGLIQGDYWQGPPDPAAGEAVDHHRPARPDRLRTAAAGHHPARPVRLRDRPAQAAPHPDAARWPSSPPRSCSGSGRPGC